MLCSLPFEKFLDQTIVPFAKGVRNRLALLAAGLVVSGAATAQDNGPLPDQVVATNSMDVSALQTQTKPALARVVATNSIAPITLPAKTEPTLVLGSRTQVSGLFVDLIMPLQSWVMLNPPRLAPELPESLPPFLLPITEPLPITDNPREPNFAILHFSF